MKLTLIAKLDKKGSECALCSHYTFGNSKDAVSGGVYIRKDMKYPPDFIEIEIAQTKG